jgi:hypothetical protein
MTNTTSDQRIVSVAVRTAVQPKIDLDRCELKRALNVPLEHYETLAGVRSSKFDGIGKPSLEQRIEDEAIRQWRERFEVKLEIIRSKSMLLLFTR